VIRKAWVSISIAILLCRIKDRKVRAIIAGGKTIYGEKNFVLDGNASKDPVDFSPFLTRLILSFSSLGIINSRLMYISRVGVIWLR
jgi:hypothetical protein